jgi:peptidyl-prolyl cis-trans isomerase C
MTLFSPTSPRRACAAVALAAGLAIALTGTFNGPAAAQETETAENGGGKVVARVNGKDITEKDIKLATESIRDSMPQMSRAERRDYVINYLTDLELVADAARAEGLDEEADVKRRLDQMQKRALMEIYLTRAGEKAATEEEAKKLFDQVIADIPPEERVRARHILVESEDEAKAIKAEIDAGKDFAEVAKEKSKDPGSGAEGGDLGWFTKEQMVPEFADTAFSLDVGQVSDPVKSDFGWHIIKVEGKRDKPGYDEVEDQLFEMLARQKQRDIVLGLREKGSVERLDKKADDAAGAGAGDSAADEPAEEEKSE